MTVAAQNNSCQIYLVAEALGGEATIARLSAAFAAASIASVLFVPPASEPAGQFSGEQNQGAGYADILRPLIALVQEQGAAALLLDDAGLTKSLKADGVHLRAGPDDSAPIASLEKAREALPANSIAGAHCGRSRDGAMRLGELGVDYVGFPCATAADNLNAARAEQLQLVAWWAEIFIVPCVAFDVATPSHGAALARAGADFVAVKLPLDQPAADVMDTIAAIFAAITATKPEG